MMRSQNAIPQFIALGGMLRRTSCWLSPLENNASLPNIWQQHILEYQLADFNAFINSFRAEFREQDADKEFEVF